MSEFEKCKSRTDLNNLDSDEMVSGYFAGRNGDNEPGSDKSRSYWHGWRNGMVDSGRMAIDKEQVELARQVVNFQKAH